MEKKSLFEQWMFEAPGDETTPDEPAATDQAPDIPPENTSSDTPPDLDMSDTSSDADLPADEGDDLPPDLEDGDFNMDEDMGEDIPEENPTADMHIDDKVSSILNLNLYQQYTALLSQVSVQINSINKNTDLLYAITKDTESILSALRKLEENMRLYVDNNFSNERYEKNLLFYNKCKNLNKFLNDKFDSIIHKGIKEST